MEHIYGQSFAWKIDRWPDIILTLAIGNWRNSDSDVPEIAQAGLVSLAMLVSITSAEGSFLWMDIIKITYGLRNSLSGRGLSNQLFEEDLESIVEVWSRKSRRIAF